MVFLHADGVPRANKREPVNLLVPTTHTHRRNRLGMGGSNSTTTDIRLGWRGSLRQSGARRLTRPAPHIPRGKGRGDVDCQGSSDLVHEDLLCKSGMDYGRCTALTDGRGGIAQLGPLYGERRLVCILVGWLVFVVFFIVFSWV